MGCGSSKTVENINNNNSNTRNSKNNTQKIQEAMFLKVQENNKHLNSIVDHFHKASLSCIMNSHFKEMIKAMKEKYSSLNYTDEEIHLSFLLEKAKQSLEDERLIEFNNDGFLISKFFLNNIKNNSKEKNDIVKLINNQATSLLGSKISINNIPIEFNNNIDLYSMCLDILIFDSSFHLDTLNLMIERDIFFNESIINRLKLLMKKNIQLRNLSIILFERNSKRGDSDSNRESRRKQKEIIINNKDNDKHDNKKDIHVLDRNIKEDYGGLDDLNYFNSFIKNFVNTKVVNFSFINSNILDFHLNTDMILKLSKMIISQKLASVVLCNFFIAKDEDIILLFKKLSTSNSLVNIIFQFKILSENVVYEIVELLLLSKNVKLLGLGCQNYTDFNSDSIIESVKAKNKEINNSNLKVVFDYFNNENN